MLCKPTSNPMEPSASSLQPNLAHRISKNSSPRPHNQVECTAIYLYTVTSFLLLITFQSFTMQSTTSWPPLPPPRPTRTQAQNPPPSPQSKKTQDLIFHPLRDPSVPPYRNPNRTWFMSTLTGHADNGFPEHFVFPSNQPNDKILCIDLHNKSYALASANHTFPSNATVFRGLTFIADSFYDYENPWHGLNSISGFFAWIRENHCTRPQRFMLFKNGVVVRRVGSWVRSLMKAASDNGGEVVVEGMKEGVVCFERTVVMRRGLGGMDEGRRHGLFEMLRCKAWRYCNASTRGSEEGDNGVVRISLVGREGKRGFKNESGVRSVMERECRKVEGCRLRLVHINNMSFCEQVQPLFL